MVTFTQQELEDGISTIEYAGIVPTWQVESLGEGKYKIASNVGGTMTIKAQNLADAIVWCYQMAKDKIDRVLNADDDYYTYDQRYGRGLP